MINRLIRVIGLSLLPVLAYGQGTPSRALRGAKTKLDFVVSSEAYRARLDRKSNKLLLESAKEHLWAKLPTELNGDYYGYALTANPYSSDEWDLYLIKLVMPALEKDEDLQRITVRIYRSHFPSLKAGGREEIEFEPESDQIVVYGKVDASHGLKIEGDWLRGFSPTGKRFQFEAKNLD